MYDDETFTYSFLNNASQPSSPLRKWLGNEFVDTMALVDAPDADRSMVAVISRLSGLRHVHVDSPAISNAELSQLCTNRRLIALGVENSKITDDGLDDVAELAELEILRLSNTKISDAGVAKLSGLANLKLLAVANTKVTDAGIAQLASLENLHELRVDSTQVTDACLVELAKLPDFRWLTAKDTKITFAGGTWLRTIFPDCYIELDFPPVGPSNEPGPRCKGPHERP